METVTTFVQKAKKKIKENTDKVLIVAAGIGALGTAYYYGKAKGSPTFEFNVFSKDEDGEYQKKHLASLE